MVQMRMKTFLLMTKNFSTPLTNLERWGPNPSITSEVQDIEAGCAPCIESSLAVGQPLNS